MLWSIYQEFVRNSSGVQLFTCGWLPAAASPKALVFLCHGTLRYSVCGVFFPSASSCLLLMQATKRKFLLFTLKRLSLVWPSLIHICCVNMFCRLRHGMQRLHERYGSYLIYSVLLFFLSHLPCLYLQTTTKYSACQRVTFSLDVNIFPGW